MNYEDGMPAGGNSRIRDYYPARMSERQQLALLLQMTSQEMVSGESDKNLKEKHGANTLIQWAINEHNESVKYARDSERCKITRAFLIRFDRIDDTRCTILT